MRASFRTTRADRRATFFAGCTTIEQPQEKLLWNDPDLNVTWPIPHGAEPRCPPRTPARNASERRSAFPDPWLLRETRMQGILVTGGAGFIGANFVHHCVEHHPGL